MSFLSGLMMARGLAQLVGHRTADRDVLGLIPALLFLMSQSVERPLSGPLWRCITTVSSKNILRKKLRLSCAA